jgi:hypothetical protein
MILEIMSKKQPLISRKASMHITAVGVLAIWSIISYIRFPVSGATFGAETVGGINVEGGLREYFVIIVGISIFFYSFLFFKYKELNADKWFYIIIFLALLLGNLQLSGIFKKYSIEVIPFLRGFGAASSYKYYTVGGLRDLTIMGIPISLSLLNRKKSPALSFFILMNFLVFALIGGGRAVFFGVVIALIVYIALINRKHFIFFLFFAMLLVGLKIMFYSDVTLKEQKYGRVLAIGGSFKKTEKSRYYNFLYRWEVFKNYPIFGKGISYRDYDELKSKFVLEHPEIEAKDYHYIRGEVGAGGHGSYFSIISIFGIGGAFFIGVMVFGSMYYALKIFKGSREYGDDAKLALFALMYLIIMAFRLTVGGAGYNRMEIWFVAGMIAGIKAKEGIEMLNNKKTEILHE